ncbi:MAG: FeoA family protein [Planctomycetota bacterium]
MNPATEASSAPSADASLSLAQLENGASATVERFVGASDVILQRLVEMGIAVGSSVRVVRRAPLGGPLEVEVGSFHLALRRSEAERVLVRRVD